MLGLSSGFCCSGDSVFSAPSYSPGTSPSLPLMSTDAHLGFGIGGESYNPSSAEYYEEYTPSSPPRRAASPYYTPESPSPRAGLPDYTPSSPSLRVGSPDYTPSSPTLRAGSPDYTPASPLPRAASPYYTPGTPPPSLYYTPGTLPPSPYYTPETPPPSPYYTPETPPPSPLQVSDAESRTSPAPRRHHPYQRSGDSTCSFSSRASRISRGRHPRALGY